MNSETVLMRMLVILGIVSLAFLAGCGGGTSQSLNNPPPLPSGSNLPPSGSNPIPTVTTVSPNSVMAGGAPFTLTINGTNFVAGQDINGTNVSGSAVHFGGTAVETFFSSTTQLTATIPAAAIASAGTTAVTVTNLAPGGGTSSALNFTITSGPNPVPTINSLDPFGAPVGERGFNLWVSGSNFVASSVVRWNGSDRPTTVFHAGDAEAQIPASNIAAAGTAAVTVFNPTPGGGSSNTSTFTITAGGVHPRSIAVDRAGKFAYVANFGFADVFVGNVSMYRIDPATGALTAIGPPVAAAHGPNSVRVDPSGKFVYVADSGDQGGGEDVGDVSMYTINATTGALASIGTIRGDCPGLCAPLSLAVDPSGKFAYVANEGSFAPTKVSMFMINTTTGALTSIGTIAAGGRAFSVAVDPKGKFAYVASRSDPPGSTGNVSAYTINAATGALSSIGTIPAGTDPISVAVDPTGKFAYVSNARSEDVSMYTINTTTGDLTSIGTTTGGGGSIAIHPSGKFAYVSNFAGSFSVYTINAATGILTLVGTTGVAGAIAIHPSGGFAYVTNGSNSVSMYSIDTATGALTLIGTIGT
jgi:6-phosphogluconolactonase (cycloisomerase 2 family)